MKRILMIAPGLMFVAAAVAQDTESTTVTTTSNGVNLTKELWYMDDTTVIDQGQVDLRLTGRWMTATAPASRGDSDDDFVVMPSLLWGFAEDMELSLSVPSWVGDGGDAGAVDDANYDTYLGVMWKVVDQCAECENCACGPWPSVALSVSARFPTGCGSSGVDGELRLLMSYDYGNGIRSHFNGFAQTVNAGYEDDLRDVQYGVVIGMDGPLCADGAVRWVFDYMNRSSYHDGASNLNMLELGWEWEMADAQKLGMSFQAGLDDHDDTPNFGASVTYSHSLTY